MTDAAATAAAAAPAELTLIGLSGVPIVAPGDDLSSITAEAAAVSGISLSNGDVAVVAQKIVSKAEGRLVSLADVTAGRRAVSLAAEVEKDPRLVELVLSESRSVLRCRPGLLIVVHRSGMILANAGIDTSNVAGDDHVLLWPNDPDASAARLRAGLRRRLGIEVGVVVNDSVGRPWRLGTVGLAIGVAGLPGLVDLRQRLDLHGRELRVSETALADEIAAAASVVMGQADEGRPIVVARGVPYARRDGSASELVRPVEHDLFR